MNRIGINRRVRPWRARVNIRFPTGEVYGVYRGVRTTIAKAVVEDFTPRFLREPGVVRFTRSRGEGDLWDDRLLDCVSMPADCRHLPDIILFDACQETPKLVFVKVVVTDGAFTAQRNQALLQIAGDAGYRAANIYFVSAFLDRSVPAFRKLASEIAWGTFAWFAAEPDKLLAFREGRTAELFSLFQQ